MTATEWIFKQLWDEPKDKFTWYAILDKAMQMEKQQIIDAVYHSCSSMTHYDLPCGEQYYNETFKSE